MSIKSDKWSCRMAAGTNMIEPFEADEICETSYKDRGRQQLIQLRAA